jgi:hypothetical protein
MLLFPESRLTLRSSYSTRHYPGPARGSGGADRDAGRLSGQNEERDPRNCSFPEMREHGAQVRLSALLQFQREGDWCRRKNRIISAEASGPCESV